MNKEEETAVRARLTTISREISQHPRLHAVDATVAVRRGNCSLGLWYGRFLVSRVVGVTLPAVGHRRMLAQEAPTEYLGTIVAHIDDLVAELREAAVARTARTDALDATIARIRADTVSTSEVSRNAAEALNLRCPDDVAAKGVFYAVGDACVGHTGCSKTWLARPSRPVTDEEHVGMIYADVRA